MSRWRSLFPRRAVAAAILATLPGIVGAEPLLRHSGVITLPDQWQVTSLALGDMTGDHLSDLIALAYSPTQGTNSLLVVNQFDFWWLVPDPPITVIPLADDAPDLRPQRLAIADLNADGALDVAVAGSWGIELFYQDPDWGGLTSGGVVPALYSEILRTADINGDGRTDLVVADNEPGMAEVLLQNPQGEFDFGTSWPIGYRWILWPSADLAVGDFNNDGASDLVWTDGRHVNASLQLSGGSFAPFTMYAGGYEPNGGVEVADFTADGLMEIATARNAYREDTVGPTLSLLSFDLPMGSALTEWPLTHDIFDLTTADLNLDGRPDLFTSAVQQVDLFYQQPATGLQLAYSLPTPELVNDSSANSRTTAIGDLNGDDLPDVVLSEGGDIVVLLGYDEALPLVAAGADQEVAAAQAVTLNGSVSYSTPLPLQWSQLAGPSVTLSQDGSGLASFTAPAVSASTRLIFELATSDAADRRVSDRVSVVVEDSPPVAVAGPDQALLGGESALLDGTGSYDPEGTTIYYTWQQSAGPTVTLSATGTPGQVSFTVPPDSDPLTFTLTVKDAGGKSATDEVTVSALNRPPVADAGADQSSHPNTLVLLDGTASSDLEGALQYSWSQLSGPAVTLEETAPGYATFSCATLGDSSLTFQLTVTDSAGATASDEVTVQLIDTAPTANAGANRNIQAGTTVNLTGSGSDLEGSLTTLQWVQVAGPTVELVQEGTAGTALFVAPQVSTTLTFHLIATDATGQTGSDELNIYVINYAPIARAGADQTQPINTPVTLDGTASSDLEGPLSYAWSQIAGPAVVLAAAGEGRVTFTDTTYGSHTLQFRLTVTDAGGRTATDDVTVQIVDALPLANAGLDQTSRPNASVTLDGTASSDQEGPISYLWSQIAGPAVTLLPAGEGRVTFTDTTYGSHTLQFQLSVTDAGGQTSSDTVMVQVVDSAPIANAGVDQTVAAASTLLLSGSGSDLDGPLTAMVWSQLSGPAVALQATGTPGQVSLLAPYGNGTVLLQLTVTDSAGQQSSDQLLLTTVDTPPVAAAGSDFQTVRGSTADLNGGGSHDAEGAIVSYQWSQLSGPTVALSATANPEQVSFTTPWVNRDSVLSFQLTVTDQAGQQSSDTLNVTVTKR